MPPSRFSETTCAAIIAKIEAGASLRDAARGAEVHPDTVKGWVARGRREGSGPHAEFVAAVEAARQRYAEKPPMSRAEFQRALDGAVRAGSVTAMKLWHEIDREKRQPAQPGPGSKIADLAERRRQARGAS